MPTKAISFLGYTRPGQEYRKTNYAYGKDTCETPFMAEATAHFFRNEIDALLVLVTKEAEQQNFADLAERFTGKLKPTPVPIRSGLNEGELWDIFAELSKQIEPGDRIIFDITNGFRSLPVLAFLATSYMRVARGATVSHMIYGAFDATQAGETPVFDLTPFLTLLDWTTATDAFLKYGRADDLTQLVQAHSDYTKLGDTLKKLTAALQTSRPLEIMQQANHLHTEIESAKKVTSAKGQPFNLLLDRISTEYTPLAHATPTNTRHVREVIEKQLEAIEWYIQKKLYVQALLAGREWLISFVLMHVNQNIFDKKRRQEAENLLNAKTPTTIQADIVPNFTSIQDSWKKTTPARNAVAHLINKQNAETADDIERTAEEVGRELRRLFQ